MLEIEPFAAGMILETMRTVGLNPDRFAVAFKIKDNKLSFNFTDDIFYAKPNQGLLVIDETGDMNVQIQAVSANGRMGIIIKEKQ
jgi:hypothetical protein